MDYSCEIHMNIKITKIKVLRDQETKERETTVDSGLTLVAPLVVDNWSE